MLARVAPLVVGLGGAALLQYFYGAHQVELLCTIRAADDDGSGVDLRVTRPKDKKLIVNVEQRDRVKGSHTIVIHTRMPRGQYRVDAWLENGARTAFSSELNFAGEEAVEVPLDRR
jgi:hypothetical protein